MLSLSQPPTLKDLLEKLKIPDRTKNRALVLEIVTTVIKTVGIPEKIGVGPIQYDVMNKVQQEISKQSDETIDKVLREMRRLLST